jgi:diguanylate cyclase (GGDEF)-like protein
LITLLDKSPIIDPSYQHEFALEISRFNLKRGKLFAPIIIGIELILLIILLLNGTQNTSFKYNWYAFMYILMIVVTTCLWTALSYLDKRINHNLHLVKTLDLATTGYIAFTMIWGAFISLNDQALYGSIVAFLVNVLVASFMFYLRPGYILFAQLLATTVLFIGLPYYQYSGDILIGHYVNGSIFIVFIWFMARANYLGFVRKYLNQKIIEEKSIQLTHTNNNLVKEIQLSEQMQKELEAANKQLQILSTLDALTGIPNRRRLDEALWERWNIAVEKQLPFSVMMIDIDYFKLYNDTNGHLAGDRCLQAVAGVLNGCRREPFDFVARFGGEEFLFVTVGMSKEESLLLGERIRAEVEALGIEHHSSPVASWITVSLGISCLLPDKTDDNPAKSLELADQALYRAKSAGRNRLVLYENNCGNIKIQTTRRV